MADPFPARMRKAEMWREKGLTQFGRKKTRPGVRGLN